EAKDQDFKAYQAGDKLIPWEIVDEFKGSDLVNLRYHQLMPYVNSPEIEEQAFRVISGDFVSTEDGTGIVHASPTFGADDFRVCQENNIPPITVKDENGKDLPIVDRQARFVKDRKSTRLNSSHVK